MPSHDGARAHVDPGGCQGRSEGRRQRSEAAGQGGEDRERRRGGGAGGLLRLAGDVQQGLPLVGGAREERDGHVERDAAGVAGIDAGEQGLDEPVGHGGSETRVDEVAHRHVLGDHTVERLLGDATQLVVGEQAAHRLRVGGDTHDGAGRHGPASAPRDDRRTDGGRMRRARADTDLLEEGEGLRSTGQHGLRADVDREAADRLESQLPADPVGGLVDGHPDVAVTRELPRRGQPGDASTDDGHAAAHGPTVSPPGPGGRSRVGGAAVTGVAAGPLE